MSPTSTDDSTQAAIEAHRRGYQAVPIRDGGKKPYGSSWTHLRWESPEQVKASFDRWREEGAGGVGLLLGEPSGGLVDVDLDHPKALRMRDYFLPPSPMQSGRAGNPRSHRWYVATGELPGTRRYKMPDTSVSVELRSTGGQTVIPPSTWYPKGWNGDPRITEEYRWEGTPWGGEVGPAHVDGKKLAVQVALLGLGTVLLDAWPREGGRHDAYLALAGGLLRFGDGVHPYWERNLPVLIEALAEATHDDDGASTRVAEVMGSTLAKLRENGKAVGFPRLAEIIGVDHAELARRMAREVESLAGFTMEALVQPATLAAPAEDALVSTLPPESRNPMEERVTSWDAVDLEPYITGQIVMPDPTVLQRTDGKGLFYPGRVNSLYGKSESAKTWISLYAGVQEVAKGERVVVIDLEDEPAGTLSRMRALGLGDDDIRNQVRYVHPESPLADMQRYKFGQASTPDGIKAASSFKAMLAEFDPTLIIVDGMTVLYGLHGHDSNAATDTDVLTSWFKSLCRGGRTTVIVIDHTGKGGGEGASPIGAHHKVAMVQGTAIRADAMQRPMPGEVGKILLVVYKDRPGVVRSYSTKGSGEQTAAIVTMDSTVPGVTRMTLDVPDEKEVVIGATDNQEAELARLAAQNDLQDKIVAMFGGDLDVRMTTARVIEQTGASAHDVYAAWGQLKAAGVITQEGSTRWTKFRLTEPPKETGEGA